MGMRLPQGAASCRGQSLSPWPRNRVAMHLEHCVLTMSYTSHKDMKGSNKLVLPWLACAIAFGGSMTISQVHCTDRETLVAMAPVSLCLDSCAHTNAETPHDQPRRGQSVASILMLSNNTLRPVKGHTDHPIELSIIPLSVLCGHSDLIEL